MAPDRGSIETKVTQLEGQIQSMASSLERLIAMTEQNTGSVHVAKNIHTHSVHQYEEIPVYSHQQAIHAGSVNGQSLATLEQWVKRIGTSSTGTPPQTLVSNRSPPIESRTRESHHLIEDEGPGESIMTNLMHEDESIRARQDNYLGVREDRMIIDRRSPSSDHTNDSDTMGYMTGTQRVLSPLKRRRLAALSVNTGVSNTRRVHDPIDWGICDVVKGRELFDTFFAGAHNFVPLFDPTYHTFDWFRSESPFSLSAILFVAQKVKDAGKEVSFLQNRLREHTETMCQYTLFSPISSLDAIQAMVLMANWGDTSWRPGVHAYSMARDMEIDKCLPRLIAMHSRNQMSNSPSDSALERALMTGTRLWLIVCLLMVQLDFVFHRSVYDRASLHPQHWETFLNHPLGQLTDYRIIAMSSFRGSFYLLLDKIKSGNENELDEALQVLNEDILVWKDKWQLRFEQQGLTDDHVLLSDLETQKSFAIHCFNTYLLRDIKTKEDVKNLPPHRRRWLLAAFDAAKQVVARFLAKEKEKLMYANHLSHIVMGVVVKRYIQLARIFPDEVDLQSAADDLMTLADIMRGFPGVRFAQSLRESIAKVRQSGSNSVENAGPTPENTIESSTQGRSQIWAPYIPRTATMDDAPLNPDQYPPLPLQERIPAPLVQDDNTSSSIDINLLFAEFLRASQGEVIEDPVDPWPWQQWIGEQGG